MVETIGKMRFAISGAGRIDRAIARAYYENST